MTHRTGVLLVMLAGVFWSLGGIIVRLIDNAGAWQILFYRSITIAIMLTLVLAFGYRRNLLVVLQTGFGSSMVGGVGIALAFTGFILSLSNTSVANTFFLLATQPILIALVAWWYLHERPGNDTMIASIVTLIGVSVMVLEGFAAGTLFGNLMGLVSALGFTVYTIALRRGRNINMLPALVYGSVLTAVFAAIMLLNFGEFSVTALAISAYDLFLCATLGIVQIGFGTFCYTMGSHAVPAAELGLLAMTEIILGPIWVWLFLNEVPTIWTLAGGALVTCALLALVVRRFFGNSTAPN